MKVGAFPAGFYIEDDGQGLPGENPEEIFGYDFSGDVDTGWGLSIVERIAHAHDWDIAVAEGEDGTRFEFTGVNG